MFCKLAWLTALALLGLLQTALAGPPTVPSAAARAAELKILLPLARVAYQTNEWIDISVVRSSADALQQGPLVLTLTGDDGSKLDCTFTVPAATGKPALATENLHANGFLLRPGKYLVRASADGASAETKIEVVSHIRQSSFKLIDWGSRAARHEQAVLGEDSFGYNVMLYAYGGIDPDEMIRGRLDYMRNCAMGGWHYMDMRRECDWSDPYVLGGGIARVSRQLFEDRTRPNCLGVHFYDEPLLAEVKDPRDPTGKTLVRYGVPAQDRSYRGTFGKDPPRFDQMHFDRAPDRQQWMEMNRWRLLLLEAAWKIACFDVAYAQPDYLPISQTQWGWHAFDAGYYFNVNRPFPVVSRHAWYDYKHGGDFAPSFSFEFGRIRDLEKPNWYLPLWGSGHTDLYRAEQYLSFINNLHGAAKPPDLLAHRPSRTAVSQGIVESNKTMARLGPIFDTLPVTRAEVAVLYSMSHNLHEMTRQRVDSYRGNTHFLKLLYLYMAGKVLHTPIFPAVEEDVLDGTLAAHHKAVLVAGIDYLDPKVIGGLQAFIKGGGTVLVSDDSRVKIAGAQPFHLPLDGLTLSKQMDQWADTQRWDRWAETVMSNRYFKAALPVAEALAPKLEALGIKPICDCAEPGVIVSRQAQGDIEYLFAVNASPDFATYGWYYLRPVDATLRLAGAQRPIYDAVRGGRAEAFQKQEDRLVGKIRFGPGQMHVFARTARPIGGVQVLTPLVSSDYTRAQDPTRVEIGAVLVDDQKQVLCGSAPLQIEVIDPLKTKRYDLYRATDRGLLRLMLPLAANDPAGTWTVRVRDLLGNSQGEATFAYRLATQCGAVAGATRRAVCFGRDREHIFRFFRTHRNLTIIKGTSPFADAAAERLVKSLAPWDIRCQVVAAADVKRRTLTALEKPTWVDGNGGAFDLRQPAILLGNPDDNALIRHLRDQKFLPYAPARDQFPGRGRGLIAWQRDGLAYFGHESLTLIGYDEAGLAEAVGSTYAIAAGLTPLTPWVLPDQAAVVPATKRPEAAPQPAPAWHTALPDRLVALKPLAEGTLALSADGTLRLLKENGTTAWQKTFDGGEAWALEVAPDARRIVVGTAHRLHVLDAQGKPVFDRAFDQLKDLERSEGLNFIALAPDGHILVGFTGYIHGDKSWNSSGMLSLYSAQGDKLWTVGGKDAKTGQPQLPDRLKSALFTADGKRILLLTEKQGQKVEKKAQLLDSANGTILRTLPGVDHQAAAVLSDNVLLCDGDSKLTEFRPAQDKIVSQLDCAGAAPVVFAPAAGGLVIGTEADGTVRLVKAVSGKLDAQTVWKNAVYTKIVKAAAVHGGRIAVTYWGGTVRIFDDSGKLLQERLFPQDVSALTWSGGQLIVGLADGQVLALQNAVGRR